MGKLTKRTCDLETYQGKGKDGFYAVWDDELRGFGMRVFPGGAKSFIVKYRFEGRQKIQSLGQYGVLTVDQARKMAREILVEVAKGNDPAKKKNTRGERMKDLAALYLEDYSKIHKKSWKEDQRRLDTRILPALGERRIVDIHRADIIKFHQRMGEERGPYEANRILALVSTMIEYARRIEIIPQDHPNPCRLVEKFKEYSRDVFLPLKDLPRLMDLLEREPNLYVRSALLLFLLTGMRKTELLTAKWDWVDFDRRELRLPDTKGGRPHYVPLTEPAFAILQNLPRMENNPYIFPSLTDPGKRLWNIDKPWRRIRAEAGLDHIHIHDLRRSVGSWMAESGVSLQIIGKVLNHADINTTKIYSRLTEEPARAALDQVSEKVVDLTRLGVVKTHADTKIE